MNRYAAWMLLLFSILSVAFGQIFLKPAVDFCPFQGVKFYCQLFGDHWIYCGVLSYGSILILWLGALKSFDPGFARPLTSFGYVLTCLAALIFFKEKFLVRRLFGIIAITFGVISLK
jgi:multidrug transporter EmrE-like cation transporter